MRRILIALTCSVALPWGAALAQDQQETLADIRQQLTMLHVEIQTLNRELSTTGTTGSVAAGSAPLDRINAIEGELSRLIGKTEELEHRIDSIVADGTRRIGDLEYRLVELEGGDVSKLGETSTLGGTAASGTTGTATAPATGQGGTAQPADPQQGDAQPANPQLAQGEAADYRAARALLDQGDYAEALEGFTAFAANYPGSPLSADAALGRAQALEGQGETDAAAKAYLDTFTLAPRGDTAPEALYGLGTQLSGLGETAAACRTFIAVSDRFPGTSFAAQASTAAGEAGCS
ncbi:tol-pal system protein YbgF [Pseudooceanicola sp. HF7]|uniref:tol-pal system protein YbgF n=1 Tax=Pseudooceanicola sp. HF7 TaxID=2721560 RepID=UPI00143016CA|nr:tol-pal system protein YbgF [Pseudooceanicola sp. HF7]NIZ08951.1 tol-pal system protein YbgF [Pseudooceanicola sp. HF7]